MSKTSRILSALALLLLPVAIRFFWMYAIPPTYQPQVSSPDFLQASVPEPPTASAPLPTSTVNEAAGKVVLIDYAHSNQFFVNEIEPFTRALTSRGAITEVYLGESSLEHALKYASAYVVISPLGLFSASEIRSIERFVSNGGRLLVFTDPTRGLAFFDLNYPDVDSANLLLSSTGITFSSDYLYNTVDNEGNFRNIKFAQFGKHPLTEKLGMVVLYGSHTVSVKEGTVLLEAPKQTLSSLTDQGGNLAGMVLSADGGVLAAGDFTFMTTPFFNVADNALLVERLAEFALGGERQPSLANFPYLFKGPVTLSPIGKTQITANLLARLSAMQWVLQQTNNELRIGDKPGPENNIRVGIYAESEEIIKKYEIEVAENEESASLPGVGQVGLLGTGMIFFERGENGSTLVLLADSSENLETLVGLFMDGELYTCVLQDDIGICALGEGGEYQDLREEYYEEPEGVELAPEPTPTPAG